MQGLLQIMLSTAKKGRRFDVYIYKVQFVQLLFHFVASRDVYIYAPNLVRRETPPDNQTPNSLPQLPNQDNEYAIYRFFAPRISLATSFILFPITKADRFIPFRCLEWMLPRPSPPPSEQFPSPSSAPVSLPQSSVVQISTLLLRQ